MDGERQPITERGEAMGRGCCQICGARGEVVKVLDAPPPNQFCERCAIEYGEVMLPVDEDSPAP